ncbi:MAG TPA: hypothetical protein VD965_05905 [Burkholderiales bacterium]|nr:hypothetical protein [Burkholderiales bacterium]
MLQPTQVHCRRCQSARPLRFAQLLEGESSLGTAAACGECSHIAFTLIRNRTSESQFSFCANCDAFCRVRVEASEHTGNVWVCCAACGYALATLYAPEATSSKASTRPPQPTPPLP